MNHQKYVDDTQVYLGISLQDTSAKMIADSLITSRLNYCNSLLFNVDDKYMKQVQRMQNSLARVVCKTSKFCHMTPVLHSLHWLEIKYRIDFKITLWFIKHPILMSLSTFENYSRCQKNKEPVSLHLVSHPNSLTSCCSYFDDFD